MRMRLNKLPSKFKKRLAKKNKVKHAVAMQNPHYVKYQSSQPAMQRTA